MIPEKFVLGYADRAVAPSPTLFAFQWDGRRYRVSNEKNKTFITTWTLYMLEEFFQEGVVAGNVLVYLDGPVLDALPIPYLVKFYLPEW